MRVFVTGATGFIGTHFLRSPAAERHEITALCRSGSPPKLAILREPTWLCKALDAVEASDLAGCESLVHLASPGVSPQQATWTELFHWNVAATLRLVEAAKAAGVRRIVVAGTSAEYGQSADRYESIPVSAPLEPTSAYAASKAAASVALTAFAREQQIELAYLRICSAFGDGQFEGNFWPSLKKSALAGEDFAMTPGEQVRDYVPVEQVAETCWHVAATGSIRRGVPLVANVGSGNAVTMRQFAEHWWREFRATGELLVGSLPYRPNEIMRFVPEVTRL